MSVTGATTGTNARVNNRIAKIEEKKHFLLDTKSLPIRQYLLDKIIPTLTKGIMELTDKLDFEKFTDEDILAGNLDLIFGDLDPLDHLISYFDEKGQEMRDELLSAQRKREQEREQEEEARKEGKSGAGDESDNMSEEESPDEQQEN